MFLASSRAALAACLEIFNLPRDQCQKRFLNNLAIPLHPLLVPYSALITQRETTPGWLPYFCVAAAQGRTFSPPSAGHCSKPGSRFTYLRRLPYQISYFQAALCRKQEYLAARKEKNMQKKSNYNKTEESPHPWGAAQQWMKEICKLFYMLLLSFLTLLSLVVPLFARLKRGGKAACQVLKFAVEGPFFRWKTELQTELPNPTSTFKVWLILCQKWHLPLKA